MTEAVLSEASGQTASASSTLTIAVTSNPAGAGNKKIIFVGAPIRDSSVSTARTITGVLFDGSLALSSIIQQVNSGPMASRVAIFAANITGTGTGNIVATASAISLWKGVVLIVDDLDQAAAAITAFSNTLGDDPVSGAGFAIDGISNVANFSSAADYSLSEGSGQTEVTGCPLVDGAGATNERNFSASYRVGGSGSQSFVWTSANTRAAHAVALFPRVASGKTVTVSPASLSYAGQAVSIVKARTIAVAPASLSYAGQAVSIVKARVVAASTTVLTYAGQLIRVDKGGGVAGLIRETWIGFRSGLGF